MNNGDGRSEADDPPGERKSRAREARASVVGALVVAVLVAAWWTARGGGGEPELRPGRVVSGFFQAQRDGDCRRLLELVSERNADATRHQELASVDVPGIEGSLAVVTECAGPSLRPAPLAVDCGQANKAAAVGARGRFVVAVELTDYRDPDPLADQLVDRAMDLLRTQLDRR